ncbi:MAG: hydroxymethylbilane synthase [Vicinamibacterales bacterium]
MYPPLRIGTRGSQLALWQARSVATRLEAAGTAAELVIIRTSGDRLQDAPLSEVGGKRLFVKEIEDALLGREIDLAVHSAKDMPAVLADGLAIAATLPRDDPRDALVLPTGASSGGVSAVLAQLGNTPRVGTSSVRRSAQLGPLIRGAVFAPVRGNVDTRLRKLDQGGYDVLVLASAGLRRLGLGERISASIPTHDCIPAPGQGIVAIEIRSDDTKARDSVRAVHDATAATALEAERAVVEALGGGCQLPLGAFAVIREATLELQAIVCLPDGSRAVRARAAGPATAATTLGTRVADELASEGAVAILNAARNAQGPVEGSY